MDRISPRKLAPDPCGVMRGLLVMAPISAGLWLAIIRVVHAVF